MNSTNLFPNLYRFIILVLVQALILKQITLYAGEWFNIFIYPLFILFLPIEIPTAFSVALGFSIGLVVDFFYNSPGVHASAGAWSGFMRKVIVMGFQPRGGFSGKEMIPAPSYFGFNWYFQVAGLFFFLHLFWYFSVDSFTFVYFGRILLKTISAWGLSMIFAVVFVLLVNPKR